VDDKKGRETVGINIEEKKKREIWKEEEFERQKGNDL